MRIKSDSFKISILSVTLNASFLLIFAINSSRPGLIGYDPKMEFRKGLENVYNWLSTDYKNII